MIDYKVDVDMEKGSFAVTGPFDADAVPVDIPSDNPIRKEFVDLFLHKADIERGIDFLKCISIDKGAAVNEGLFIAGLNNCMKCFKFSQSRGKLNKNTVFADNEKLLECFTEFEKMRDKHFDHDESGMLQATAFLLVSPNGERVFAGPPSVVWNKAMLDYYVSGQKLQEVMQYTWQFLCKEIDKTGCSIEASYSTYSRERLLAFETAKIKLASSSSKRQ